VRLAIFDLDGTLTRTTAADDAAYLEALSAELGFQGVDGDWSRYRHATDPGILEEVFRAERGRAPNAGEVDRFRACFVGLLRQRLAARPTPDLMVPGAAAALADLRGRAGWALALATGSWRAPAEVKLAAAALDLTDVPAAYAEDGPCRETILTAAIARAEVAHGGAFEAAVYTGDGIWDLRAARGLGLGFVGIAEGSRALRLAAAGARRILPDFGDREAYLLALDEAADGVRRRASGAGAGMATDGKPAAVAHDTRAAPEPRERGAGTR
jgi:phosphoglycolate phosphatase-like HAD superfamily hydrolase